MAAISEAGLITAALNGIAVEFSLYGGTGARQFTDTDLLLTPGHTSPARTILLGLDYHSGSPEAMTFTRHLDDIVVPRVTIDLTPATHHASGGHDVRNILGRRCWQSPPDHEQLLPVLAAPDALRLLRACHDPPAIQRNPDPSMPASARAGWARLRRLWPELSPAPFPAGQRR